MIKNLENNNKAYTHNNVRYFVAAIAKSRLVSIDTLITQEGDVIEFTSDSMNKNKQLSGNFLGLKFLVF